MFKEIVVGIDPHHGGDALELASRLADSDARITLAHVLTGDPYVGQWVAVYIAGEGSIALDPKERDRAVALLERVRREAPAAPAGCEIVTLPVPASTVGRGLHQLAEDVDADLIVVGSSQRSTIGRVVLGDDARAALNGAPAAVAIAPAGYATLAGAWRSIGVGYDGSPESEGALAAARQLARAGGAAISALTAVQLPLSRFGPGALPVSDAITSLVDEAREKLQALGGLEAHAAYGPAADELAMFSESVDLLVVGSRGYGPVGRLMHGSTSWALTRTARCALLVLPRGRRPGPAARAAAAGAVPAIGGHD